MISVIFDMDGTLLDTQKGWIPAWSFAGEKQGYENLGRLIPSVCGMNENGWKKPLLNNAPDLDIDIFIRDANEYYAKNCEITGKEGMHELLTFLKANGVKMAVASGTRTSVAQRNIKIVGASEYIDIIIGGEMVKNGKPAPDIFLLAAEKLGAEPQDCIVFEDSENGLRAALAAEMRAISVPDVDIISEEVNKQLFARVNKLSDAISVLEKLL